MRADMVCARPLRAGEAFGPHIDTCVRRCLRNLCSLPYRKSRTAGVGNFCRLIALALIGYNGWCSWWRWQGKGLPEARGGEG